METLQFVFEGNYDSSGYNNSPLTSDNVTKSSYSHENNKNQHRDLDFASSIEKTRERNREHAKKTRLRKKASLEGLKARLIELQLEASRLQQILDENNTANILLCLSNKNDSCNNPFRFSSSEDAFDMNSAVLTGNIIAQLRNKVRSEAAEHFKSRSSSSDYFTSDFCAEETFDNDAMEAACDGESRDSEVGASDTNDPDAKKSPSQLIDNIRKERNRMHAKFTRDRKKLFTSELQQLISSLERQNLMMMNRLKSFPHSMSRFEEISNTLYGSSGDETRTANISGPLHQNQRVMYHSFGSM